MRRAARRRLKRRQRRHELADLARRLLALVLPVRQVVAENDAAAQVRQLKAIDSRVLRTGFGLILAAVLEASSTSTDQRNA
jgi:hypothetical protein